MVKTLKRGDPAHSGAIETMERKCKGNTKTQATNRGEFSNFSDKYSRTSMARTRQDHRCEFDPSMCSSDT